MKKTIGIDLDGFLTRLTVNTNFKIPDVVYFLALNFLSFFLGKRDENIVKVNFWKKKGYKIVLISARPEILRKTTERWLLVNGISVNEIVLVGSGEIKEKKLEALKKRGIAIYYDDNLKTVNFLRQNGINAFCK